MKEGFLELFVWEITVDFTALFWLEASFEFNDRPEAPHCTIVQKYISCAVRIRDHVFALSCCFRKNNESGKNRILKFLVVNDLPSTCQLSIVWIQHGFYRMLRQLGLFVSFCSIKLIWNLFCVMLSQGMFFIFCPFGSELFWKYYLSTKLPVWPCVT